MLRYVYDESGSPIGMKYRTSQQAAEYYTLYFFEKNAFGDIIGIYDSNLGLLGTYTYDAWGNCTVNGTDSVLTLNPFRYRGYYYDTETGFYYLQSRYYNPAWGRFLNTDVCINANGDMQGFNMYLYCSNNPISFKDSSGAAVETVFDLVSIGFSIADVAMNPDDPWAWAGLAGDLVDLIPFVTCVGETVKATRITSNVIDVADDVGDTIRTLDKVGDSVDTVDDIHGATRIADFSEDASKSAKKIHNNSLKTDKITEGYILRDITTHEILKYGETTRGLKRYTNTYLTKHHAYMDFVAKGTKAEMHQWQHEMILNYISVAGQRPPLNKNLW